MQSSLNRYSRRLGKLVLWGVQEDFAHTVDNEAKDGSNRHDHENPASNSHLNIPFLIFLK
jgi:hypothetical protein